MSDREKQLEIAERLQLKLLERFEMLLDKGTITSTDLATLCKLLSQNGWQLDPLKLPKGLRDKLTEHIDPSEFDDGAKVLPFPADRRNAV